MIGLCNSNGYSQQPAYLNTSLSTDARVRDLVSRLTLKEKVDQMMYTAPAIPRLNIPAYNWWNEALHGVARSGPATVFPQAIGLAAIFDNGLALQEANAISDEARAMFNAFVKKNNARNMPALLSGHPISISFAIRGGEEARKLMEKIHC